MNKVSIDTEIYYKNNFGPTACIAIDAEIFNRYGISFYKYASPIEAVYEIIDSIKFSLMMLEYPEYIIKVYE